VSFLLRAALFEIHFYRLGGAGGSKFGIYFLIESRRNACDYFEIGGALPAGWRRWLSCAVIFYAQLNAQGALNIHS
jgi:hypothetical protein